MRNVVLVFFSLFLVNSLSVLGSEKNKFLHGCQWVFETMNVDTITKEEKKFFTLKGRAGNYYYVWPKEILLSPNDEARAQEILGKTLKPSYRRNSPSKMWVNLSAEQCEEISKMGFKLTEKKEKKEKTTDLPRMSEEEERKLLESYYNGDGKRYKNLVINGPITAPLVELPFTLKGQENNNCVIYVLYTTMNNDRRVEKLYNSTDPQEQFAKIPFLVFSKKALGAPYDFSYSLFTDENNKMVYFSLSPNITKKLLESPLLQPTKRAWRLNSLEKITLEPDMCASLVRDGVRVHHLKKDSDNGDCPGAGT